MADFSLFKTINVYPGNGTTGPWSISWAGVHPDDSTAPYISIDDVFGFIVTPATPTNPAVFEPVALIPQGGATPTVFRTLVPVPVGKQVWLRRVTEANFGLVNFHNIITVTANDLDLSNKQMLFLAQESVDAAQLALDASQGSNNLAYEAKQIAQQALTQVETAISTAAEAKYIAQGADMVAQASAVESADAKLQAQQAWDRATQALNQANSAITIANGANSTANSATIIANNAATLAGQANTKANTAVATADAANTTAGQADTKADNALSQVATANTTASNALTAANAANTTAGNAVTQANTATSIANDAKDTAEGIDAKATEALSTANAAASTANGIDAKATEALSTANAADAKAQEALDTVQEAGVASFNARTGIVVPVAGDYTADMVPYGGSTVSATLAAHAGALNNRVVLNTGLAKVYATDASTGGPLMLDYSIGATPSSVPVRNADRQLSAQGILMNNWTAPPAGLYGIHGTLTGVRVGTGTAVFDFGQDGNLTVPNQITANTLGVQTTALINAALINSLAVLNPDTGNHELVLPTSGAEQVVVVWTGPSAGGVAQVNLSDPDFQALDEVIVEYAMTATNNPQYSVNMGRITAAPLGIMRLSAQAQNLAFTLSFTNASVAAVTVAGATSNFTFRRVLVIRR